MSLVSNVIKQAGPLGLYRAARLLTARVPKVLMYHRFSDVSRPGFTARDTFARQLAYLCRHFTVLTLSELVDIERSDRSLPANAIVLTVDDGFEDFHSIAFPLLREFGVRATLFVTTGFVNGDLWLWPDQVTWLLEEADAVPETRDFGGVKLEAGKLTPDLKQAYWGRLIHFLLSVPDAEKHQLIRAIAAHLGLTIPVAAPAEFAACSWDQLREMQAAGIDIGGHTVTHPSLGRVSEAQAQMEIMDCYQMLTEHLGNRPRPFCYPNGTAADFNPMVKRLVADSGFTAAVTAFDDCEGIADTFAMRRFPCGDNMFQFYKCVSGMQHLGNQFRKKVVT